MKNRVFRRGLVGVGLVALALVLVGSVLYYRQIASYLTHTVASPRATFELVPFPADAQPDLRIGVAGDVGDGGDLSWRTASSMYVVGSDDPFDVLFLLGDNVYPNGEVALLHEKVLNPFASLLDTGADLIAVLGNHDGMAPDGGARQMELLGMPGRWWSSEVGSVLLVGLDTNQVDNPAQLDWLGRRSGRGSDGGALYRWARADVRYDRRFRHRSDRDRALEGTGLLRLRSQIRAGRVSARASGRSFTRN